MHLTPEAAEKLLTASTDAIVVVDADGGIVFTNPQADELFGYESGELLGQPIEVLVPDSQRGRHREFRKRFRENPHGRPLVSGLALYGQHKNGDVFAAEIALMPVEGGGRPLVAGTIRKAGAADTSEAYFRNLLEAAPDAMIIVDDSGRIAIANHQSEKMFGYAREDMIGQPIEMLLPETARERHVAHRRTYMEDPNVRPMGIDMELFARRADGSTFPVEISLSPVKSASGLFVSSMIRDVTRRKEMETALIEARQAAERAHKANTAFLTAASHDLRQPVQALSLLTGALRRTVKEPVALEMIESQQHSLDAMTNLLNSLLDISRLDAGVVTPEFEEFPLRRLFARLSAESARQARQKGLKFTATGNGTVIRSDPNLLAEIIQNFVSNAIRYTERGGVTLGCRELDGHLAIDVGDTGVGIETDQIEEIFREFHQLRKPGGNTEGFGLGLAIARRLADLLGHRVEVTSVPGEGSRFSVVVPAVEHGAADATPAAAETRGGESGAGGVILLVEDDRKVARAWSMLLEAEGFEVLTAESADEAEAVAAGLETPPDLVISDYHLFEGQTGVQAVTGVRRHFSREIPAFVVSGDTSKVVEQAQQLPNSMLLAKPVPTDHLLNMARKAIASGSAGS